MSVKGILKNATGELNAISSEVKELSQVHAQLLKVEAQECADFIKKKVIAGVMLALIGFFLACVILMTGISAGGIFLKEHLPEGAQPFSWHIVAASVSLFFLLIILICLALLKKKPTEAFFSQTKQEIQNDKVWLQNLTKRKSDNS